MVGCGALPPPMGGRRRKTRKMKGGNFYGPGGAIAPGAMQWNAVENVAANPVTGALIADGSELQQVKLGGRRRKSRKASRKSKKVSRRKGGRRHTRKMRGGATYQSAAGVGYGYAGTGVGGLADPAAYASKVAGAGDPHVQNAAGVMQV